MGPIFFLLLTAVLLAVIVVVGMSVLRAAPPAQSLTFDTVTRR
jgi:hypothetical protein